MRSGRERKNSSLQGSLIIASIIPFPPHLPASVINRLRRFLSEPTNPVREEEEEEIIMISSGRAG